MKRRLTILLTLVVTGLILGMVLASLRISGPPRAEPRSTQTQPAQPVRLPDDVATGRVYSDANARLDPPSDRDPPVSSEKAIDIVWQAESQGAGRKAKTEQAVLGTLVPVDGGPVASPTEIWAITYTGTCVTVGGPAFLSPGPSSSQLPDCLQVDQVTFVDATSGTILAVSTTH